MKADWLQLPDTAGYIPPRRSHRRLTLAVLLGLAFLAGSLAGRTLASTPRPASVIPAPHPSVPPALVVGRQPDQTRTEAPWVGASLPSPTVAALRPPVLVTGSMSGQASWFGTGPDGLYAAAGPALRRMLGPKWRGRYVTVSAGGRSIRVRLTDWCGCYGSRLLDLSDEAFAGLAALSRGLVRVTVVA